MVSLKRFKLFESSETTVEEFEEFKNMINDFNDETGGEISRLESRYLDQNVNKPNLRLKQNSYKCEAKIIIQGKNHSKITLSFAQLIERCETLFETIKYDHIYDVGVTGDLDKAAHSISITGNLKLPNLKFMPLVDDIEELIEDMKPLEPTIAGNFLIFEHPQIVMTNEWFQKKTKNKYPIYGDTGVDTIKLGGQLIRIFITETNNIQVIISRDITQELNKRRNETS